MAGYTDSTTWEAWLESLEVLWNNTSLPFVLSVLGSVAVILATWIMLKDNTPHHDQSTPCQQQHEKEVLKECEDEDVMKAQDTGNGSKELLDVKQVVGPGRRRELESFESNMTEQQRAAEREAQSQQLAAIFKMMQEQEEKFGETTIDDIKDQMKLYCG